MEIMDDISQRVEKEIETRGLVPTPRWHFLVRRSVFWTLAVASVLVGGVAFSVGNYIFFDNEGISTAALLESPLEGVIQTIPFVWLFAFGLFVASAYLSLKHTRTGYRYGIARAVLAVIAISICLGILLDTLDFGQAVHYFLLNNTSFYDAVVHSSDDIRF
jgi:hypothetical protein